MTQVQSLRTAFTLNDALKRLFLSSTALASPGAIALAEFLPESTSLLHLDLTMNTLDLAGVMALSSGLKANHTMRCLDLNIPPADEEMARYVISYSSSSTLFNVSPRMCRDILNTCVRNTEEAEKQTQSTAASGRGQAKGVWGMIEESELAKTFRQDDQKKVQQPTTPSIKVTKIQTDKLSPADQRDTDVLTQARLCKAQLEDLVARSPSSSSAPVAATRDLDPELTAKAKTVLKMMAGVIETTGDPGRLEELLTLNDDLTGLLAKSPAPTLTLSLNGLGIRTEGGKKVDGLTPTNGSAVHVGVAGDDTDEDEEPVTPRIDKGKGRAEPEPEKPEKVLSPTFLISGEEDDGTREVVGSELREDAVSPTEM